jgi:Fe-S-cluster containining protein
MITCDMCPDSACCRDVVVELDEPTDLEDWDEIRWMVSHKNVAVYLDNEDDWVVEFKTPCENLDHRGKCNIYSTRMKTCRDHRMDSCVKNGEGTPEKIRFDNMKQVEEHVEKIIIPDLIKETEEELENIKNWKWGVKPKF